LDVLGIEGKRRGEKKGKGKSGGPGRSRRRPEKHGHCLKGKGGRLGEGGGWGIPGHSEQRTPINMSGLTAENWALNSYRMGKRIAQGRRTSANKNSESQGGEERGEAVDFLKVVVKGDMGNDLR